MKQSYEEHCLKCAAAGIEPLPERTFRLYMKMMSRLSDVRPGLIPSVCVDGPKLSRPISPILTFGFPGKSLET